MVAIKRHRLIKEIFPVGTTILTEGPEKHEAFGPSYVVDVALGPDHTASFYVDRQTVEAHPEYFEPIEDDGANSAGEA